MNDRELLELAAKSAGYEVAFDADGTVYKKQSEKRWIADPWNPLTDDGDALRLAITCGITDLAIAAADLIAAEPDVAGKDVNMLIRRSIVFAAAELGRAKP